MLPSLFLISLAATNMFPHNWAIKSICQVSPVAHNFFLCLSALNVIQLRSVCWGKYQLNILKANIFIGYVKALRNDME